jgi:serine/threonine protein kinase
VGAGAFGCVFRPALRCASQKTPPRGFVTKLGRTHDIEEEKASIDAIGVILRDIPHYDKFFVVDDITVCEPAPLHESDLRNVKDICHNFKGVNVNEQLHSLRALNMPDAGQDLFDYFSGLDGIFDEQVFLRVNTSLMRLVQHGIMPLSVPGIIHSDVKLENMVIDTSTFNIRLIDWGNAKTSIPAMLRPSLTPFVFNRPPGSVFLHANIDEMLAAARAQLRRQRINATSATIANELRKLVPESDTTYIDIIIRFRAAKPLVDPIRVAQIRKQKQVEHLANILDRYYDKGRQGEEGTFYQTEYITETYIHNCDLYGFVVSYVLMLATMTSFALTPDFDEILKVGIIDRFMLSGYYANKPMNKPLLLDMMKQLSECVLSE